MTAETDNTGLIEQARMAINRLQFNADFQRGYGADSFFFKRADADLVLAALAAKDAEIAALREALGQIAGCQSHTEGDVVYIAQAALGPKP